VEMYCQYTVIILSDKYRWSLPVGSFIVLTLPTRAAEWRCEVTNYIWQTN